MHHLSAPRGSTRHCQRLAEGLADRNFAAQFYCLAEADRGQDPHRLRTYVGRAVDSGLHSTNVDVLAQRLSEGLLMQPAVLTADIVHIHDIVDYLAIERIRPYIPDVRLVRTVHHVVGVSGGWQQDVEARSLREADAVVAVSHSTAESLEKTYGVQPDKVIHSGVDKHAPFPPIRQASRLHGDRGRAGAFIFLTTGGITPRKGTLEFFQGLDSCRRRFPDKNFHALIVGGGSPNPYQDYRAEVARFLENSLLRAGRDYSVLGVVSDEQLEATFSMTDVYVAPSLLEGWGLAVLEMMALGIPTILSDLPAFREIAPDYADALFVPPGDWRALAGAMELMMFDEELRDRVGRLGPAIAERYTWGSCADQHAELYSSLLA